MSDSFMTPWTVARQAPLSMVFPQQEYWSRLPFPHSGDLPDSGIKPTSPALTRGLFTNVHWENPDSCTYFYEKIYNYENMCI